MRIRDYKKDIINFTIHRKPRNLKQCECEGIAMIAVLKIFNKIPERYWVRNYSEIRAIMSQIRALQKYFNEVDPFALYYDDYFKQLKQHLWVISCELERN